MSTKEPTYEELQKRLTEAERTIRALQDKQAEGPCGRCDRFDTCERRYRDLVENLVDVVFTLGAMGHVTSINSSVREMLGYEPEEVVGRHFVEWIAQDQRPVIMPIFKRILGGQTVIDETVLVGKDGKAHDVEFRATCIVREGNVLGVQGILRDITEQKKAAEALRRAEEKYRMLFDGAMDAIFVGDAHTGLVLDCNRAAVELTGREKSELIGQPQRILHPPQENDEEISESFRQHLNERRGETIETQVVTKDGQIREVAIKASLLEIAGKELILGVFRDITVRKRSEEMLLEREAFLNTLLDAIPTPVFYKDREGRYLGFNKAFEKFFDATKQQLIGKTVFDINPPDLAENYHAKDRELFENGGVQKYESQVKNSQGVLRDVIFNKAVYTDTEGMVSGLIGAILDITEHKRAQEEIRSVSKFPSENPSPVLRVHKNGTVLYSNEAGLPLLADLKSGVGEKAPFKWWGLIDEAFESGETQQREQEISGRIFSFVIAPILDGDYVNLYARDISEGKKTEADLRKSEERFKQVVEIAGDWVWEVDAEGMYTYASPVVERVLGYKPEEIVGKKHFYDFFPPEEREDLRKAAFETFTRRECFMGFVNQNVHKDGSVVVIETSGTPIVDEEGNFCGYRGVDRDITERQRREAELRKMNEDLVLASRKAGMAEVATDVLHNVANVLNSINVSANFINEKLSNSKATNLKRVTDILAEHTGDLGTFLTQDDRGKHIPVYLTEAARLIVDEQTLITEKLRFLTKNVQHVTQIIKAQQSYSRSGGVEACVSVHEVIEDAIEINHAAMERYGIELRRDLTELPRARMDRQRILQILVNLMTNAKQALSDSDRQERVLTIRCGKHGPDRLRIEVADNGVGIERENLSRIFTHGFTTKAGGHGFGLHGSALAAREMGGCLTVHSDGPGHGATFTLELPLKSEVTADGCR
jgi:PAS domain S-box-containing protein